MNSMPSSDVTERLLSRLLPFQAETNGDAFWAMFGDFKYTFDEANTLVDRYAAGFSELGLGRGQVVGLLLDNSPEFLFTVLALVKIGAVSVPINTAYKGEFLRRIVEDSRPAAIVVDSRLLNRLSDPALAPWLQLVVVNGDVSADCQAAKLFRLEDVVTMGAPAAPADISHRDPASIMFTSGTTGRSKGVIQSHHYWYTAAQTTSVGRDVRPGDVFHCCTPMFHSGAWVVSLLPSLLYGLPVGVDERFSVSDYWRHVRDYRATQLFTLGAMHMWLWAQPPEPDEHDNPGRVWVTVPLPSQLWEPFRERYGLEAIWSCYGQTEVMPATVTDVRRVSKPGSCGFARPDYDVRIVDEYDRFVASGEVGEIVVRPREPDVMFSGYHQMPEMTLEAFRNLWYHTGDLGRMDEDGELFFVDRRDDYLRRRGENISSLEVEGIIRRHPALADVAVHAVPADDAEDEMKLCVVCRPGVSVEPLELARFCAENLPYFAVPRYIEVMEFLPRTPTERVQKFLLRERGVTEATWDGIAAGFDARAGDRA